MFRIANTHAYKGCRVSADAPVAEGPTLVEFSDGVVAGSNCRRLGEDEIELSVDAYRTSRGTDIRAKVWLLRAEGAGRWRIKR